MTAPRTGALRAVRAGTLGAVTAALATAAHLAAGGAVPGVLALLLLGAGVVFAAVLLTRVRLGLPAMVLALGLGQFVLHHLLAALAVSTPGSASGPTAVFAAGPASGSAVTGAGAALVGHHHGSLAGPASALAGAPGASGMAAVPVTGAAGGVWCEAGVAMTALHVVATLLGALVLARGEAALWALVQWCRPLVPGAPVPVVRVRSAAPAGEAPAGLVLDRRRGAPVSPRGPPGGFRSVLQVA